MLCCNSPKESCHIFAENADAGKKQPMDYYSIIAAGYDELHGAEQDEKLMEFLQRIDPSPQATLLDVGCGTGRSMRLLDVHWHGIDPSPGLLAHASPPARLRMKLAPAEAIPYPDASFDIILSLTALQNFQDPAAGIVEMQRVAKPGALFLISFLKKSPRCMELRRLLEERFTVQECWEHSKDAMYICTSKRI